VKELEMSLKAAEEQGLQAQAQVSRMQAQLQQQE